MLYRSVLQNAVAGVIMIASIGLHSFAGTAGGQLLPDEPAAAENIQPVRTIREWNATSGRFRTVLKGYDPVAYFPEGGGEAKRGEGNITVIYKGTRYQFATVEHRTLFLANPTRYEPAYGGWCAWAMAKGDKTDIDPRSFIVRDDRLYVFYDGFFGDTKADWEKGNHEELSRKADEAWLDISGESPRHVPLPDAEAAEAAGEAAAAEEATDGAQNEKSEADAPTTGG